MLIGDQIEAANLFESFLESEGTVFGLLGYAGTGKSFTTAHFIKKYILGTTSLVSAPTHKAAHVTRRFLDSMGIPHQGAASRDRSNDPRVGTTAQMLGIRPIIGDEQDDKDLKFAKGGRGIIEMMDGDLDWILIEEVSMLSASQFNMVRNMARERDARIMVIGDPGQLPPVNANPMPFDRIHFKAVLSEVKRTDDETGITALATAIRSNEPWQKVKGTGVFHVRDSAGAFLHDLDGPMTEDEREWSVYIAYRNAAVDAVNEAACRKVYGHGAGEVAQGEIVLAANTINTYVPKVGRVALCTNGEALKIEAVGRPGMWGVNMTFRSLATGEEFVAEYLAESDLRNPEHPFNIEVANRRALAQKLEKDRDPALETERRVAWARYFDLRDSTVIAVTHPFALTSHKSQGSTYLRAYVDAKDMAPFDPRALYVGATRPSDELIIG